MPDKIEPKPEVPEEPEIPVVPDAEKPINSQQEDSKVPTGIKLSNPLWYLVMLSVSIVLVIRSKNKKHI